MASSKNMTGQRQIQNSLLHTHVVHLGHVHAGHHIVDKGGEFLGRLLDRGQAAKDGDVIVTAVAVIVREEGTRGMPVSHLDLNRNLKLSINKKQKKTNRGVHLREGKDTVSTRSQRGSERPPGFGSKQGGMDKDQGARVGSGQLAVEVVDTGEATLVQTGDVVWQGGGEAGFIRRQHRGSSDRAQEGDQEAHKQGKEGLERDG